MQQQPNYIYEINKFHDWLETNQISKSAIALWHGLMHIANKTMWEEKFTVAISTLESKTGFKRSELYEARNILVQKGRIAWRERGGNRCAEYTITFFGSENFEKRNAQHKNSVHTADTNTATNPTQMGTQKGTINKPNSLISKQDLFTVDKSTVRSEKNNFQTEISENPPPSLNTSGSGGKEKRKSCAKKKKEKVSKWWPAMVKTWFDFYIEALQRGKPRFGSTEGGQLRRILQALEDKALEFGYEWTEAYAVETFGKFLRMAWDGDPWFRKNFLLKNLDVQFDKVLAFDNTTSSAEPAAATRRNFTPPAKPSVIEQNFTATQAAREYMRNHYSQNAYSNDLPNHNQYQQDGADAYSQAGEGA